MQQCRLYCRPPQLERSADARDVQGKMGSLDKGPAVNGWNIWSFMEKHMNAKTAPSTVQEKKHRPSTAKEHNREYSSFTRSFYIVELHPQGLFVKLQNCSDIELDIGEFHLQQNMGGHPVAVFRFPPLTLVASLAFVTVWAEASHRCCVPPKHFLWTGLEYLGASPDYTTILCQEDGQAVAWYTPACCTTQTTQAREDLVHDGRIPLRRLSTVPRRDLETGEDVCVGTSHTLLCAGTCRNLISQKPFVLREMKKKTYGTVRSPWTQSPGSMTHPVHTQPSPLDFRGMEKRSVQAKRLQSSMGDLPEKRDTIRGATHSVGPCAGLMFMGSGHPVVSPLQHYWQSCSNTACASTCFPPL